MQPRALVPMLRVLDVQRSIEFFQTLGFALENSVTPDGEDRPSWAYLSHHRAQLMLSQACDPVVPEQQAVLFYLYFEDIAATRAAALAAGLKAGPMSYPIYGPKGEFELIDPDGYCLMLTHT